MMKKKYLLLIAVCIFLFTNKNIAQEQSNYPDLTFEKKVKGSIQNKPIELEIVVKNIGNVSSSPAKLSIDANYNCVAETDIKRLNLELVDSDFFYQVYRITKDIPALKSNETATFTIKLDRHYTENCGFYIQIDREKQLIEQNENNNQDVFPAAKAIDYGVAADLVIKKINRPHYKNDSTFVTIEVENIGFDVAKDVILKAWEISAVMPQVSERDLKALFGHRWWMFKGEKSWKLMFDISKKIGSIHAGETAHIIISFKGWIYNPDCRLGVEVDTTSRETDNQNNFSSFLEAG